jgi:hypothetical protein
MMVILCNHKAPFVNNEVCTVAIWLATELTVLPTYSIYFDSASSFVIESYLV